LDIDTAITELCSDIERCEKELRKVCSEGENIFGDKISVEKPEFDPDVSKLRGLLEQITGMTDDLSPAEQERVGRLGIDRAASALLELEQGDYWEGDAQ
jgi:hypothetical protein